MYMRNFMTTDIITTNPKATLKGAHKIMNFHGISHLPIIDEGKVAGILSGQRCREIINEISIRSESKLLWDTPVAEFMTNDYILVSPDDYLRSVSIKLLEQENSVALVVAEQKLVGIVTIKDMFRLLIRVGGFDDPGIRIQINDGENRMLEVLRRFIDQEILIKCLYFVPSPDGSKALHIRLDSKDAEKIDKEFGAEFIVIKEEE